MLLLLKIRIHKYIFIKFHKIFFTTESTLVGNIFLSTVTVTRIKQRSWNDFKTHSVFSLPKEILKPDFSMTTSIIAKMIQYKKKTQFNFKKVT